MEVKDRLPMTQRAGMAVTPHPGSDEARSLGCICAVLDNNHGKFAPLPPISELPEAWYITVGCPLHHPTPNADP